MKSPKKLIKIEEQVKIFSILNHSKKQRVTFLNRRPLQFKKKSPIKTITKFGLYNLTFNRKENHSF